MTGNNFKIRSQGFTLIEIIAVLLLVGVLATGGTYAISKAVEAYMFTKDNSSMAQKAQAAINRMMVDFTYIDKTSTVSMSSSANSFTYVGDYPTYPQSIADVSVTETNTISQNENNIMYGTDILLDNVTSNSLAIQYLTTGGVNEGSFTSNTVIVKVTFTIKVANDQNMSYTMQTYVGKAASIGS